MKRKQDDAFKFYQVYINASDPEISDNNYAGYFPKDTIASPSAKPLGNGSVLLKFRSPLNKDEVIKKLNGHINNGYITEIIIK